MSREEALRWSSNSQADSMSAAISLLLHAKWWIVHESVRVETLFLVKCFAAQSANEFGERITSRMAKGKSKCQFIVSVLVSVVWLVVGWLACFLRVDLVWNAWINSSWNFCCFFVGFVPCVFGSRVHWKLVWRWQERQLKTFHFSSNHMTGPHSLT